MRLVLNLARRILRFGERRGVVVRNAAAAHEHRLAGLITVSLLLGLRPGEAAGLTWGAVDFDATPPPRAWRPTCGAPAAS